MEENQGDRPVSLEALGSLIRTQDNCITNEPIFVVEQRVRHYGFDNDYAEDYVWLEVSDGGERELDKEECDGLDEELRANGDVSQDFVKTHYKDIWEFVMPFFTESEAQNFIECNKHNYAELRIYVYSAHNNREWKFLRAFLKSRF